MILHRKSPCKVNLLLNILGKRPDGFHELETLFYPVAVHDELSFEAIDAGVQLACSEPSLPVDSRNLVFRAAIKFMELARVRGGVRIHLKKNIPLAAGLGGGSANAATTLLALNELFDHPLTPEHLHELAADLGSDVPFFLQTRPAIATGRGEKIEPLESFDAFAGMYLLLIHPGFGVPTAWAYQHLAAYPNALSGAPGRVRRLAQLLGQKDSPATAAEFYNALEAPVFRKYPLLAVIQDFLKREGATDALMSGSGSTTFALLSDLPGANRMKEKVRAKFGECWMAVAPA